MITEEGLKKLLTSQALQSTEWSSDVKKYFGPYSKYRQKLNAVAIHILSQPEAINHSEWTNLVMAFIDCSQTYEHVTADVYGVTLNYGDTDEGGIADEFYIGNYSTLELVFSKILSTAAASQHPAWERLVRYAWEAQDRYSFYPKEKIINMLSEDWTRGHPNWAGLLVYYLDKFVFYKQERMEILSRPWVKGHKDYDKILIELDN